jgi:nucleotide-binding universal stress UspA family protein
MSAYQTLVVGTDGSDTSFRAVDHAAAFAAKNNAKLIVAMAHLSYVEKGDNGGWGRPARPDRVMDGRAEVALGSEGDYKVHGMAEGSVNACALSHIGNCENCRGGL